MAGREARHIVVQAGQSISRVANTYRVPESALIAANHLGPPYKIKTGQTLVIPASNGPAPIARPEPRQIVVEEGQSISRIAAKYRVPESAIIDANHLAPPYKLKIGSHLVVPGADKAVAPVVVGSRTSETIPLDEPAPHAPTGSPPSVPPSAQPPAEASQSPTPAPVSATPTPLPAVVAPALPPVPAAAPAGVTCPSGTTGAWSTDITKQPVYICR